MTWKDKVNMFNTAKDVHNNVQQTVDTIRYVHYNVHRRRDKNAESQYNKFPQKYF